MINPSIPPTIPADRLNQLRAASRTLWRAALATGGIAFFPGPLLSQDTADGVPVHLADGPWLGHGVVTGPLNLSHEGITITWNGRIEGVFDLQVEDGRVAGEVIVDGGGTTVGTFRGNIMQAESEMSGSGTAEGSPAEFAFTGTITSRTEVPFPPGAVNTQTESLRIRVRITEATCSSARGEWVQDWNASVEQGGWPGATLQGEFVAERQDDAVRQEIQTYLDEIRGLIEEEGASIPRFEQPDGIVGELPPAARSIIEGSVSLLADFNRELVDRWNPASEASRSHAFELIDRAVELYDLLMLDPCVAELLGEASFDLIRSRLIDVHHSSVIRLLEHEVPLRGGEIETLVEQGTALDAFDPLTDGSEADADRIERAYQIDEDLRLEAERVVQDQHYMDFEDDRDGGFTLDLTDEVMAVLRAGAEREWSFEFYHRTYAAGELLERATQPIEGPR